MTDDNQYRPPSSNIEHATNQEYGTVNWLAVSGRLGRVRFITYNFVLLLAVFFTIGIATLIYTIAAPATGSSLDEGIGIIVYVYMLTTGIIYLIAFVFSIVFVIQRSHDFNTTGWLCLLYFIPLVNLLFILLLLLVPGTDGENKFGLKTPPNGSAITQVIILAITIPLMGIIAAIAIPAYQTFVEKANQIQMQDTK